MIEIIGFLAGVCFVASAIPLAYGAVKSKKAETPWSTVLLVVIGSAMMLVYSLFIKVYPLIANMSITLVCWLIIAGVKLHQRKEERLHQMENDG